VVAPETAAHAAGTSALLPMLALGIPGSPTAAVLLGGLLIWGLQPGPMLFIEQKDFVWGLIASMYMANVVAIVLVLATIPLFAAILRAPFAIIGPRRSLGSSARHSQGAKPQATPLWPGWRPRLKSILKAL
jgi:putative tricarboxylic transport membrane protein